MGELNFGSNIPRVKKRYSVWGRINKVQFFEIQAGIGLASLRLPTIRVSNEWNIF